MTESPYRLLSGSFPPGLASSSMRRSIAPELEVPKPAVAPAEAPPCAALAPRRPGSWKASRGVPRRTCTGRVPVARGSVSRVLSPPGSGTVCSDALAAIGAPPGQEWPGASPFRGNLHLGPRIRSAAIDACRCLHLGAVMRRQPYVSTTLTAAARTPTPPRCLPRQPLRPTRGSQCSGISFMFSLPVARD